MVKSGMPSPVGHVIGGIATAWAADLLPGHRSGRTAPPTASFSRRSGGALTLLCAGLAALPDMDLVSSVHRTVTHSLTATAIVTIVAIVVTGWVTPKSNPYPQRRPHIGALRVGLMCGAAYASHLFLDWLAVDRNPPAGIQLLWPFNSRWFISGVDVFPQTERREFFSWPSIATNVKAIAWEAATMLPILAALWLIRVKALARLATELSRGDHAP